MTPPFPTDREGPSFSDADNEPKIRVAGRDMANTLFDKFLRGVRGKWLANEISGFLLVERYQVQLIKHLPLLCSRDLPGHEGSRAERILPLCQLQKVPSSLKWDLRNQQCDRPCAGR